MRKRRGKDQAGQTLTGKELTAVVERSMEILSQSLRCHLDGRTLSPDKSGNERDLLEGFNLRTRFQGFIEIEKIACLP